MFWGSNHSSPSIDTLLVKPDVKLNEVLDHENVIQDLRSQNQKLLDFITKTDVLSDLVTLVTEEPSPDLEENERYKLPNIACEVLTTNLPRLNEFLSEKIHLVKLFSFLENDPPLNPLLSSFVSRTLSLLISRNVDQNWYSYQLTCLKVLEFLKSTENSSQVLLKHLGTSAIMDLTFKLLTQVEGPDMQQNLLDWIESVHLVENIVALIHPSVDADRQANAAQLLCDTIDKLRGKGIQPLQVDPILNCIQSPDVIKKLLSNMFDVEEISENSIAGGISVLLTLLKSSPSELNAYDDNSGSGDSIPASNPALPTIISVIVPYLPKLHNLLINPPKKNPIKLACGTIEPPLGNTRLTVIKLISALIATNTLQVNEILDELNSVHVLLDLFFHYTWNNFLHSEVDKCLAFALNASIEHEKNPLMMNIFIKSKLLQRILGAWEDNETDQGKGGRRRGYMGHLINIANSIVRQCEGDLGLFLKSHMDAETMDLWQNYVNGSLHSVNQLHSKYLGGAHPAYTNETNSQSEYNSVDFSASLDVLMNSSVYNNDNVDFEKEDTANSDETEGREKMFTELFATKEICFDDIRQSFMNDVEPVDVCQDDPWQEVEAGDSAVNDGWANFADAEFENPFEEAKDDGLKTHNDDKTDETKDVKTTPDSLVILTDKCEIDPDPKAKKSDNNANLNSFKDPLHEEELIDNFRFLSKQGMMSETSLQDSVNKSSSDSVPRLDEESRTPDAPQDPV